MMAVLVESFFLDNKSDMVIGDAVEEQRAFGVAYAKAILEYLGIAYIGSGYIPPKEETEKGKLYRVQVGAYSVKENAERKLKELKEAGFDGFIV